MSIRRLAVYLVVALFASLFINVAQAKPSNDEGAQGRPAGGTSDRVIVGALRNGKADAAKAIKEHGGRVLSYNPQGRFFVVEAPGEGSEWTNLVKKERRVRYAEPDHILTADVLPNDPRYPELWGMGKIGAPAAWDTQTGSASVVVGVIDSGVAYNHEDLADQMWTNPGEIAADGIDNDANGYVDDIHGINCIANNGNPFDDNRHGTHVAGTIGASGNNGIGVAGVNWDVSIMALKFLNAQNSGFTSDAVQCLDYATRMGVNLTNNSWGGGAFSQALFDAIERARAANDLFVAAAGNNSANTDRSPHYPSSYSNANIISVASTTSTDARSSFSNYGSTTVDLGAPGSTILSTIPGGYGSLSGTSMATPHVAGAAALLWAANPSLTWTEVRDAIFDTVDPLAALSGLTVTGGRLNVASALASLGPPPPPPPVPDAPTLQATTAVSHMQIDVSWTDVATESSYRIERSSDGIAGWEQVGTTSADITTFHNTGLSPSTTYYYRVVATNAGGDSPPSDIGTATTEAAPPIVTVHVGDLDRSSVITNGKKWTATVSAAVHNSNEAAVSGATVLIRWSTGTTSSCTTGTTGTCNVTRSSLSRFATSVSATVTGVSHSLGYSSAANHDPDGDSNGTTIVISRP